MKLPRQTGCAGSGLTEVLIALLIFVVMMVGVGSSVLGARRTSDSSWQEAIATTLGLDKVEELRTLLLINPNTFAGGHTDPANPLTADGSSGGIFTRTWNVTADVPVIGMRRLEMTVTWNDRGKTGSVVLVSYLSLL